MAKKIYSMNYNLNYQHTLNT